MDVKVQPKIDRAIADANKCYCRLQFEVLAKWREYERKEQECQRELINGVELLAAIPPKYRREPWHGKPSNKPVTTVAINAHSDGDASKWPESPHQPCEGELWLGKLALWWMDRRRESPRRNVEGMRRWWTSRNVEGMQRARGRRDNTLLYAKTRLPKGSLRCGAVTTLQRMMPALPWRYSLPCLYPCGRQAVSPAFPLQAITWLVVLFGLLQAITCCLGTGEVATYVAHRGRVADEVDGARRVELSPFALEPLIVVGSVALSLQSRTDIEMCVLGSPSRKPPHDQLPSHDLHLILALLSSIQLHRCLPFWTRPYLR